MNRIRVSGCLCLLACVMASILGWSPALYAGIAHDPRLTWKSLRSAHFVVHFHDAEEPLARTTITIAERVHARLSREFKWIPGEPTDVILTDGVDLSNGYAQAFPANRITLYVSPPDNINGLEEHNGWLETVITHEYMHILHLDRVAGAPRFLRHIFGRNFLLFPGSFQPSWMIEGLATHTETDTARGYGRGQSAYFDMLMRIEARDSIKPLSQVNQPIATWPSGTTPYLYGVQFYNYISTRHGAEKIPKLVENYSNNLIPFFVNSNSRQVLGKSIKNLWPDFGEYITTKYANQTQTIQEKGVRQGTRITEHGYYTGGARTLPDGTLIYLSQDGKSEPALMRWSPGAKGPERLASVHLGARFDVHPSAGILLAQPEIFHNANLYFDLYRVDVNSGKIRRLTYGARYRYGIWSPEGDSIIAVHQTLGVNSLHRLSAAGQTLETLWTAHDGEVLATMSGSPDGVSLVAAVWRPMAGWNLEQFFLADRRWTALTHDTAVKADPQFSSDGASILFTSDHNGVYNVRRLILATGDITTLTNVESGAFSPSQATPEAPLYYTGAGRHGFDLYRLNQPQEQPLLIGAAPDTASQEPVLAAPTDITLEKYSPYSGLRPRWWLPHIAVDTGRTELGIITSASDPLARHIYSADVAYDFRNNWPVGDFNYVYDRWYPIFKLRSARYNEIETDSNNEAVRVRRSDTYQTEVILPLLSYRRRWSLHASALQVQDTDGWVAAGTPALPDTTDNVLGAALVFDSTRRYTFSISRSNGRHVQLVHENSDTLGGSDYTGKVSILDWREFVSLGNEHVLALRLVGGWGQEQPRPFQLGGSRSAVAAPPLLAGLDYASPFYQRDYALRGYTFGAPGLVGRRMALSTLEWRFPVRRIERGIMAPPLALHQVFGSVFVDTGAAWDNGSGPENYFTSAGIEANADTILFYNVGLNLRLGYAHGYNKGGDNQIYLRAGASF